MTTPYDQALDHIHHHPGSGSEVGLGKLILSLFNGYECPFSYRECIGPLDSERTRIALACVTYFTEHGEDQALIDAGKEVYKLIPHLWQIGAAGYVAKEEARRKQYGEKDE